MSGETLNVCGESLDVSVYHTLDTSSSIILKICFLLNCFYAYNVLKAYNSMYLEARRVLESNYLVVYDCNRSTYTYILNFASWFYYYVIILKLQKSIQFVYVIVHKNNKTWLTILSTLISYI